MMSVELLQERMERRLPPAIEAAAYRIIQEALTNVVRHAQGGTLPRLPAAPREHGAHHD